MMGIEVAGGISAAAVLVPAAICFGFALVARREPASVRILAVFAGCYAILLAHETLADAAALFGH